MTSIKSLLNYLYIHWIDILVCIGLLIGIIKQTLSFMAKTREEKIEIAKKHISESMLKMISDAEMNWNDWSGAGSIKRSEVIKRVFDEYPILSKVIGQDELIAWIDEQINQSLKTLREVIVEQM